MSVVSIKTVFRDHWKEAKSSLHGFYPSAQWSSIKEAVAGARGFSWRLAHIKADAFQVSYLSATN